MKVCSRQFRALLAGAALLLPPPAVKAGDFAAGPESAPFGPDPVSENDFAALKGNSPFLRSLDLSQSLVLTGVATIEGELFATLVDRETKATHVVSKAANPKGWRMVGVEGDRSDFLTVSAQIAMEGGEVFSVRFDERQVQPPDPRAAGGGGRGSSGGSGGNASPSANYREGISSDGFRGPPPPEIVEKMSRMTVEQRDRLVTEIARIRERNPNLSSEERQGIFRRMVDRMAQERR